MMFSQSPSTLLTLLSLSTASLVSASPVAHNEERQSLTGYAPTRALCPSTPLIRDSSSGVNSNEAAFIASRQSKAATSFQSWLAGVNSNFPKLSNSQYPTMGLVDGGGGLRGFLISAGIHKAFDSAESVKTSTSGLYQSMAYEAGLSGTSASLYSYVYNGWPTTTTLENNLWRNAFNSGVLMPDNGSPAAVAEISADVVAKQAAGYEVSIVDAWARYLSYASLDGADAGVGQHVSDVLTAPGYTSFTKPYPIVTIIGVENSADGCGLPPKNASQYEVTPHEFGSWETGINNFIQTKYVGTTMTAGEPIAEGLTGCTTGFDNVGWFMATSTNTFNQICGRAQSPLNEIITEAGLQAIEPAITAALGAVTSADLFALMPNPFAQLTSAPRVSNEQTLLLVDGGETIQVPPIWPFLYRPDVDVLWISDNSADNPSNYAAGAGTNLPSGRQIHNTYLQAQANGVANRMPVIPTPAVFEKQGLNKRAVTFFGCNEAADSAAMTFIYMPNRPAVFNSSQSAGRLQYDNADFNGMIANGVAIATNNGDSQFATCLGCAAMKRAAAKAGATLPKACTACFTKYCYN